MPCALRRAGKGTSLRVVYAGASEGTASPGNVPGSQRECKQGCAGPLPGTQLGENRGGPASPRS